MAKSFAPGDVLVQVQLLSVAHSGKHLTLVGSTVLESGRTLVSDPDTASFRPVSCAGPASAARSGKELSGDELSGKPVVPELHATPSDTVIKIVVAKRKLRCCMGRSLHQRESLFKI